MKRQGIAWKNFLILMSFLSVVVLILTFLIYRNAIEGMKKEMCNASQNQIAQIENNFTMLIGQANRLTSSICVAEKTKTFWGVEDPEILESDFYQELKAFLKKDVYGANEFVSSIVLYSPDYQRVIDENMKRPYEMTGTELDVNANAQWIEYLQPMDKTNVKTMQIVRAVNDSYPYVLTFIKQCALGKSYGAAAIDIDLKKIYSAIVPKELKNLSVWILDSEGNVIVEKDKKKLLVSREGIEELQFFEASGENLSRIWKKQNVTVVYSQNYNEETGFYIVSSALQSDFDAQMKRTFYEAAFTGISGIALAGLFVMIYVYITSKPWKSILSLVENPTDYEQYLQLNEKETQQIADYIIKNIQDNNSLRTELENRLQLLGDVQMQALKAQINPHFLFNTLNAIVMMIDAEVEESQAAEITIHLADILHYALSEENLVALKDELEYARKYAYILEKRYHGRFQTEFYIAPELKRARVPKLILQPLLENAVFHGMSFKDSGYHGKLQIFGWKENYCFEDREIPAVHIDIVDNGVGMTKNNIDAIMKAAKEDKISMKHVGISNVAKRLEILFPKQTSLLIDSKKEKGTRISLFFPYTEKNGDRKQ